MLFVRKPLLLYLLILIALQVAICALSWRPVTAGNVDFRNFYANGYMVRTGEAEHLYDYAAQVRLQSEIVTPGTTALPLMVPPCVALAFAPLSVLPYIPAYLTFAAINLLLLGLALFLFRPYVSAASAYSSVTPLFFFLGFPPLAFALAQGQLSIALLVIYCGAFAALQRGRDTLAGLLLSMGLLKLQIAVPVVALFLLWRQWRFVLGFIAGGVAFVSACLATVPHARLAEIWHSMFATSSMLPSAGEQVKYGIYPQQMPNIFGLCYRLTGGGRWTTILTIICSLALFAWAARRPRSLPFAMLVALLVSYHLYVHDLTLLLLPFSILLSEYLATAAPDNVIDNAPRPRQHAIQSWALGSYLLIAPLSIFLIGWRWACIFVVPTLLAAFALSHTRSEEASPALESASASGNSLRAHI